MGKSAFTCQQSAMSPFIDSIFGPLGLRHVVSAARQTPAGDVLSFTLEIQPPSGRSALAGYGHLFRHWRDLANAERMDDWIDVLLQNHRLIRDACAMNIPYLAFREESAVTS
jgi:hypothetical protein